MNIRIHALDSLRGSALLLMTIYHFCFDLSLFGAAAIDFQAPLWIVFRGLIVTLFVGISGAGFALTQAPHWARLRRLGGCALVVSLGTAWIFPEAWIFFGVLHFLFIMSLVAPYCARAPRACLPLGAALTLLPFFYRSFFFERPFLRITGLSPLLPRTVDFVPLLPWAGVVLFGIFAGSQLRGRSFGQPGLFAWLGRHSLLYYMLHQGALLPLAWGVSRIFK